MQAPLHHLAWDGLSLEVPWDFEPGLLGPGFMRIDSSHGPAMEIRWSRVRGMFAPEKQIKRLTKAHRDADWILPGEKGIPHLWQDATKELASQNTPAAAFAWIDGKERAVGAAIHFPQSNTACVLQWFGASQTPMELAARCLTSLQDHQAHERIPWALYGIRALIPSRFALKDFSFQAGLFRINFQARQKYLPRLAALLTLERFGPASVILSDSGLSIFAKNQYKGCGLQREAFVQESEDGNKVQWRSPPKGGRPKLGEVRIVPGANKILATTMQRARPIDEHDFKDICADYGTQEEIATD